MPSTRPGRQSDLYPRAGRRPRPCCRAGWCRALSKLARDKLIGFPEVRALPAFVQRYLAPAPTLQ